MGKRPAKCRPLLRLEGGRSADVADAAALLRGVVRGLFRIPGGDIVVLQGISDLHLPIGKVGAHEVHHMVALVGAALAVDDAGVAGLTGGIEAPVVELGDHLALGDSTTAESPGLREESNSHSPRASEK